MDVSLPALQRIRQRDTAGTRAQIRVTWLVWAALGALVLGSFALRLVGVTGRPFWQDEGLTLYQIQLSLRQILAGGIEVQGVMTQNTHPPLYFLLLGLFGRLVGYDQLAVRWFSIAWSVLTIPILFDFGRRLGDRRIGLVAALLAAASPLYLWYAQEVRMYSMVVCLSALSGYLFWRALTERTWRLVAVYTLATAALMWTHYTALFLIAVQAGIFVLTIGWKRPKWLIGLSVGLSVAIAPFVPFIWRRVRVGVERDFSFVGLDTIARDLLHSFVSGVSMPIEGIWYFDLLIAALALAGTIWLWQRAGWRAASILGALLVGPVLLLYAATYIKPMYQNVRHLIVVSPYFYLLAAAGLAGLSRLRRQNVPVGSALAVVVVAGWLVLMGQGTVNYFTDPRYQKDDTRSLFGYIAENFRPGDIVVLNDAVLSHVLEYEEPQLSWTALPNYGTNAGTPAGRQQFERVIKNWRRVWFIYSPFDSMLDPERLVKKWFEGETYLLEDRKFHGTTIGLAMAYRDTEPTIQKEPYPVEQQYDASFADGLNVYGATVQSRRLPAGGTFFFELVWHVRRQPGSNYKVGIQLRGPDGQTWAMNDELPFPQIHPTSHWIAGDYLRTPHQLDIPPGTPPGQYEVFVTLYDATSRTPLARVDGGGEVSLGQVTVQPGAVPAEWQPPQEGTAQIGTGWQVHGVDMPDVVRVGNALPVEVFVSATQPASAYPDVRVELVDQDDAVIARHEANLITTGFTGEVPVGTLLRHRQTLAVPPLAEQGTYAVRAVFLDDAGQPLTVEHWWGLRSAQFVTLDTVAVEDRPRQFEVPADVRDATEPIGAGWAQGVTLARATVPARATTGEGVPMTFIWEAAGPTDRSYKLFVHLRNEASDVVAQADAYPAAGSAPTNGWADGEVVVDEHTLSLPADLPEGDYRLVIGFYDEGSGQRLPRAGEESNEYTVGTLEVRAP